MTNYIQYKRQLAVLDQQWNESDHPRDADGKFTEGGGKSASSAQPTASLRITVKPIADIKAYRKKTFNWYRTHLQGKTITHPDLGVILFSRRGGNHILTNSAEEKLALTYHLEYLIKNGKTDGWHDLEKVRVDGWDKFAYLHNNVLINGKLKDVGVVIAKDSNGRIFYNIGLPKKIGFESDPQSKARRLKTYTSDSIDDGSFVVNIFIEGK